MLFNKVMLLINLSGVLRNIQYRKFWLNSIASCPIYSSNTKRKMCYHPRVATSCFISLHCLYFIPRSKQWNRFAHMFCSCPISMSPIVQIPQLNCLSISSNKIYSPDKSKNWMSDLKMAAERIHVNLVISFT